MEISAELKLPKYGYEGKGSIVVFYTDTSSVSLP